MLPRRPIRRRRLVHLLGKGVITAALAGIPYLIARQLSSRSFAHGGRPEKRLFRYDYLRPLRPPGVSDERHFLGACIQCGNCGQVCPVQAIRFYGNDGGPLANTPFIQPEIRGCMLCGKCPEVCPSGALRPTPAVEVRMGKAVLDRSSCYPWVDQGICGACVSVCPLGEKAIRYSFANIYRPVVEPGCVGCGMCMEVCPHPAKAVRIVPNAAPNAAKEVS